MFPWSNFHKESVLCKDFQQRIQKSICVCLLTLILSVFTQNWCKNRLLAVFLLNSRAIILNGVSFYEFLLKRFYERDMTVDFFDTIVGETNEVAFK